VPSDPVGEHRRDLAPDEVEFNAAVNKRVDAMTHERAEALLRDGAVPDGPGDLATRAQLQAQEQLIHDGVWQAIAEELLADPDWQARLDRSQLERQRIVSLARRQVVYVDDVIPRREEDDALAEVRAYAYALDAVWRVRFDLATRDTDRAATILRLELAPFEPPNVAVTHTALAALPVPSLIRRAIETLERDARFVSAFDVLGPHGGPGLPSREERERIRAAARKVGAVRPQRGRRPTPNEFWEAFSLDVVETARRPRAGGIIRELARRYKRPHDTVKGWVRKTRQLGFLDGWELGPNHPAKPKKEEANERNRGTAR
jgi:hypothetical protein